MGYGNTEALRRLGITADLRVEGGSIALGEDGRPEGLLRENAYFEAFRKIPACPPESLPGAIERAVADYNRAGFTAFQDGGIGLGPGAHAILSRLQQSGPARPAQRPRLPALHAAAHGRAA